MRLKCSLLLLWGVWLSGSLTERLAAQEAVAPFPKPYNSEPSAAEPPSATEALKSLHLPSGFSATLFASEPEVQNPIAGTVDARGRVWIAENYTYAERAQRFDLNLRDRVVVLEDEDGDGVAEKRTVFSDTLQMLTGIVVGQGGVWLTCPPQLLFIPDADGDLIPDGPAQVKLDGFHVARENYHNFANGLSWGPDSWLYGRCGTSCPGELGLPGTSAEHRVPLRGGMWRFHPQRNVVEALIQGPMNPWGHDWNAVGELFFINTVNGHLWHSILGAHYVRPHSLDANPHSYERIDTHADHWHFDTGESWTHPISGGTATDTGFGGGHAHVGMMIYQEPTWPPEYQQRLMTINMHGRRVNVDRLDEQGSGYVGRHEPDIFLSDDTWSRGMELLPLPDGNVLLLDWSDTGECHDSTGVHRTSGRIYKLIFDGSANRGTVVQGPELRDDPLKWSELQSARGEWQARRARELLRALAVRRSDGDDDSISSSLAVGAWTLAKDGLTRLLDAKAATPLRLRALWSLWAINELKQDRLLTLCDDGDAAVRSWAIRLLSDHWGLDTTTGQRPLVTADWQESDSQIVAKFVAMATNEPNASVRLTLASTLQRMPVAERVQLAAALMAHTDDAEDHNLPLMVWYGIMPLGSTVDGGNEIQAANLKQLVELASGSTWPRSRRLIVRRLAEEIETLPVALEQLIAVAVDTLDRPLAVDIVHGAAVGLAGRRQVSMPRGWSELQRLIGDPLVSQPTVGEIVESDLSNSKLQSSLNDLNVLFGDGVAIEELKRVARDESASMDARRAALSSLVDSRAEGLRELCLRLLKQRYLNEVAARGLAIEVDDEVGKRLLASYRSFTPLERPRVISMLTFRKNWGEQLLRAVGAGEIDRSEITPFQARQLSSFHDQRLDELLAEHWGQARETDVERFEQMQALRKLLTSDRLAKADRKLGRALFDKNCAGCHTLYGEGGRLAPDLTGGGRGNLDYLLENIVDPSAVVTKEFRTTVALLEDGRVLTGLMTFRNDDVLTLSTQEQTLRVPVADIAELKQSATSTMPDGLLSQLSDQQILNLFAYLQSTRQVERP